MTLDDRRKTIESRIAAARRESPEIAEAINFYGVIIGALLDEDARVDGPALDAEGVGRKFAAGEPILHGESLGMDEDAIRLVLLHLCEVTQQFGKLPADLNPRRLSWWQSYRTERDASFARGVQAAKIRRALADQELDFGALMDGLLGGNDAAVTALASQHSLDENLLATLARFALRPTMRSFAQSFAQIVRAQEDRWQRGQCPVCGSPPVLSEYNEAEQSRRMRCATCGTSWKHRLLQCAFCGSDAFRALLLLQLEGDPRYLVSGCGVCKHYVKGLRTTASVPDDLLPLEDLLSLSLDAAAQAEGYIK